MKWIVCAIPIILASVTAASEVTIGAAIDDVRAAMDAEHYTPSSARQVTVPRDRKELVWSVNDGSLEVLYSTGTGRITGVWFVHQDGLPKAKSRDLVLEVTRFDPQSGEMLVQTRRK